MKSLFFISIVVFLSSCVTSRVEVKKDANGDVVAVEATNTNIKDAADALVAAQKNEATKSQWNTTREYVHTYKNVQTNSGATNTMPNPTWKFVPKEKIKIENNVYDIGFKIYVDGTKKYSIQYSLDEYDDFSNKATFEALVGKVNF